MPLGICGVEGLKRFEIGCIDELSRKEMTRLVIGSRLEAQRLYWERLVGYTISRALHWHLWCYGIVQFVSDLSKQKGEMRRKKLANDTPHNPDAQSSPRLYIYQSSEWLIPLLNASIIPPVHDVTIFCRSPVNSISPHIRLGIPLFSHVLLPRCINRNGLQCEQWRDVRRLIVPVHGVISPTFDSLFPGQSRI